MGLLSDLERQGAWLFRWRSFLPLAFLAPLLCSLSEVHWRAGGSSDHPAWGVVCLAVSLAGLVVRALVVGHAPRNTSGRNTHEGQVAQSLNRTGIYSLVRHPLYLGNFLIGFGAVLLPGDWQLATIYCLAFWLYYERIMLAEEAFLRRRFGALFDKWAAGTPAFVPRLSGWKPAAMRFSLRNVLKREHTALMLLVTLHAGFALAERLVVERRPGLPMAWLTLLTATAGVYLTLRALKKHTRLLEVSGR